MRFFSQSKSAEAEILRATAKAVIDIGSNSVRLVIYGGPARAPLVIFNEKVMAGLGKDIATTGKLAKDARLAALAAVERFLIVARAAGVESPLVVATAAVRDASNGAEFVTAIDALGTQTRILSGGEEGEMAGMGVLSGIPDADGIAADLGGGSLELVNVDDGQVSDPISFPLGVLRVPEMRKEGRRTFRRKVNRMIDASGWAAGGEGRALYLVGGSFRALARIDMLLEAPVLGAVHQYEITPDRIDVLEEMIAGLKTEKSLPMPDIPLARREHLPAAATLLSVLVSRFKPSRIVISSTGLREGLLYDGLSPDQRTLDPLIEATRFEGALEGRFPDHGEMLDTWIAPLFDDPAEMARLRLAAAHLADVGWRANPDFRADRAVETALHGNWIGIDARGRALVSHALNACFAGGAELTANLYTLAATRDFDRAHRWGSALRLAQRLSGGNGELLRLTRLEVAEGKLVLALPADKSGLYGDVVRRRHKQLAQVMSLESIVTTA